MTTKFITRWWNDRLFRTNLDLLVRSLSSYWMNI